LLEWAPQNPTPSHLTPFPQASLERRDLALTIGDFGRYANATNLISQAQHFLVDRESAVLMIGEMEACVRARWYAVARREGVSEGDCEKISRGFTYEGFRFPASACRFADRLEPVYDSESSAQT